jgi:hypothetical protein
MGSRFHGGRVTRCSRASPHSFSGATRWSWPLANAEVNPLSNCSENLIDPACHVGYLSSRLAVPRISKQHGRAMLVLCLLYGAGPTCMTRGASWGFWRRSEVPPIWTPGGGIFRAASVRAWNVHVLRLRSDMSRLWALCLVEWIRATTEPMRRVSRGTPRRSWSSHRSTMRICSEPRPLDQGTSAASTWARDAMPSWFRLFSHGCRRFPCWPGINPPADLGLPERTAKEPETL